MLAISEREFGKNGNKHPGAVMENATTSRHQSPAQPRARRGSSAGSPAALSTDSGDPLSSAPAPTSRAENQVLFWHGSCPQDRWVRVWVQPRWVTVGACPSDPGAVELSCGAAMKSLEQVIP